MSSGVQMVARSDRGRVRSRNEDYAAADESLGIGVLADGMGGLRDGHLASREAVLAVMEYLGEVLAGAPRAPVDDVTAAAVRAANRRVREFAGDHADPMGTTVVALCVAADGVCRIAHVGDSRAYRFRAGRLEQLTRDHSLVQDLVDRGVLRADQARRSPNRNVITRAVGLAEDLQADSRVLELAPDDLVLLCSDGLWDMLDDAQIARLLGACGPARAELGACADRLVAAANAAGGADNVSVLLARRQPPTGGA